MLLREPIIYELVILYRGVVRVTVLIIIIIINNILCKYTLVFV